MKILQLGKFYPVLGGVEKVMFDLTVGLSETGLSEKGLSETGFSEVGLSKVGLSEVGLSKEGLSEAGLSEVGLSEEGVECDMMCAASDGRRRRGTEVIRLNPHGRILCHRTLTEAAKTTIAPSMVTRLRRIAKDYDIIHIHHPDPMAAMALRLSGYKGKVVLHWHSDILSQKALLRFYLPIQNWLIKRADTIVGTTPVYLAESPYLQGVQEKCRCIPIGIEPVISDSAREQEIRNEYSGRRIIFSLGRLVEYKGYRYLIEAAKYLDDSFMILIGGGGPLRESLQREIDELGVGRRVKLLGKVPQEDLASYYGACELFCMSSVMKTEAFGIVQIEAFSTGKEVPGKGGNGYWLNKQKFSFGDVRMDAMLNLCNAFCGYKAEGRFWNPSLYAGLGFAWTFDEPGNGKSRSHEVSASIGTSNDFRLSDAWAVNLDVRGMFVNDRFDGEMGHRWGEGVLSATIGLTYNIAPRGWNKSKTVVKTVNNNIADFQKALSESETERIRLEKELAELRAQPQVVEKQTTVAAPYFVIFEINKSKLNKASRVNLGMLAEIIKANNIKYIVTGYADAATGNKKINDRLSRNRAQAVYDCLTKEFGVPADLLELDFKGGVDNMFYDDPALSRAVITKAK